MEPNQAEIELSIIKKVMEDSRHAVYDRGIQGIFWSILIAVTLIINYVIIIMQTGYQYIGLVWLVLMTFGTVVSIYLGKKEKKEIKVKTFAGRVLIAIWSSIGVSNTIIAIAAVFAHAFDPLYIIPVDSIILGVGFYITGVIQQMKIVRYLSLAWWAVGAVFFIFPSINSMLFFSVMLIISLLIPALENRRKWKAQSEQTPVSELDASF